MADFLGIKKQMSDIEALRKELDLKQLQINRLLNITQAINNNVSAQGLYEMYRSFLGWELGIKQMALYIREDDTWPCAAALGVEEELCQMDIRHLLPKYTDLNNLEEPDY